MLTQVNAELDETANRSFADLPSELIVTEDHRMANFRYSMATFEASKKLLRESESLEVAEVADDANTLLRRLEIFETHGSALKMLHTVLCTGFNATAPRLLYSTDTVKNRAVLDRGACSEDADESNVGGPLFLQLLTDSILRSFAVSQVSHISCGFEHCIALTASGRVVSWGYGASGSLGHGDYVSYM